MCLCFACMCMHVPVRPHISCYPYFCGALEGGVGSWKGFGLLVVSRPDVSCFLGDCFRGANFVRTTSMELYLYKFLGHTCRVCGFKVPGFGFS